MKTAKNLLINKWKNETLGHFYILRAPLSDKAPKECLNHWVLDFLKVALERDGLSELSQISHPDVHIIEKSSENPKGQYTWSKEHSDFKNFLSFMDYKRVSLKRKIVVITDGHLLTEIICNKILKSLEEAKETSIFLLMPNPKALLETIESRAITINLRSDKAPQAIPFFEHDEAIKDWLEKDIEQRKIEDEKKITLKEFNQTLLRYLKGELREASIIHQIKENPELETEFMDIFLDVERFRDRGPKKKESFLKMLKWFDESKRYNNPLNERYYQLLKTLT